MCVAERGFLRTELSDTMLIVMRWVVLHVVLTAVYGDLSSEVAKSHKPEYTSGGVGSYSRGGLYAQSAVTAHHGHEPGNLPIYVQARPYF